MGKLRERKREMSEWKWGNGETGETGETDGETEGDGETEDV